MFIKLNKIINNKWSESINVRFNNAAKHGHMNYDNLKYLWKSIIHLFL